MRAAASRRPSRDADLVIVNTCSVTATADQGARQTIRRIARENPGAQIVATGCYATRCADEVAALPGVVRVVRNDDKLDLVRTLDASTRRPCRSATRTSATADGDGPCGAAIEPGRRGPHGVHDPRADRLRGACAYCIIPTTRGASRSRPVADLVARDRAGRGRRLQGSRRSPACTSDRTGAT